MNERIGKLAEKARLLGPGSRIGNSHEAAERFAQLIIQECCDVLKNENILHHGYGYSQGFLHKKIKEHFGVGE